MPRTGLSGYERELDRLIAWSQDIEPEFYPDWGRYVCIRLSGYVEYSVQHFFSRYLERNAGPPLRRRIGADVRKFYNPRPDTLKGLFGSFSDDWRDSIAAALDTNGRGEALSAVSDVRNSAAHGGQYTKSPGEIRRYYDLLKELVHAMQAMLP